MPEGLTYVLRERQMAFPPGRRISFNVGDRVLLYTTRGIFRRPTRDRGRVVGTAEVTSATAPLDSQRQIGGRIYASGCHLRITGLVPLGHGLILADIVTRLEVFQPNPQAWSVRMRRSTLALPPRDAELISAQLKPILCDPEKAASAYLELSLRNLRATPSPVRHRRRPPSGTA